MRKLLKMILVSCVVLFISGCSFVASRLIPLHDIQPPTGEYNVGTQIFFWVDDARNGFPKRKEIKENSLFRFGIHLLNQKMIQIHG